MQKKLFVDTLLYSVTSFLSKFIPLLLLPIYTLYLNPDEYGQWDLIITYIGLITPIVTLELVSAIFRWIIVERQEKSINKIISTGNIQLFINFVIFTVLFIVIAQFIKSYDFTLIYFYFVTTTLVNYYQQISRGLGKNKLFALSGLFQAFGYGILSLVLLIGFQMKVQGLFLSGVISNVLIIVLLVVKEPILLRFKSKEFDKYLLKDYLKYSLPLVPGALSWWLMNTSNRLIINAFLGDSANGIYAVANKIPVLLMTFLTVFFMAWKDNTIKYLNNQHKNFLSNSFKNLTRMIFLGINSLILLSPLIMYFLVAENYYESWRYSIILTYGVMYYALSVFYGNFYLISKNTKHVLWTTVVGAVVNVTINLILINQLGLFASPIAFIVGYFVTTILRIIIQDKINKFKFNLIEFIGLNILTSINIILALRGDLIYFIVVPLSILLLVIMNFKFIVTILKNFIDFFKNKKIDHEDI